MALLTPKKSEKKILLVDDEKNIVETLTCRLESAGYKVITAYDGKEALKKALQEKPRLIMLDLVLPKKDGYEVCRALKADQEYKKIPIILFTAWKFDGDEADAYQCGADAYLHKPVDSELLLSTIKKLLQA